MKFKNLLKRKSTETTSPAPSPERWPGNNHH